MQITLIHPFPGIALSSNVSSDRTRHVCRRFVFSKGTRFSKFVHQWIQYLFRGKWKTGKQTSKFGAIFLSVLRNCASFTYLYKCYIFISALHIFKFYIFIWVLHIYMSFTYLYVLHIYISFTYLHKFYIFIYFTYLYKFTYLYEFYIFIWVLHTCISFTYLHKFYIFV